jgi:hypothetical protein
MERDVEADIMEAILSLPVNEQNDVMSFISSLILNRKCSSQLPEVPRLSTV